jgi:hypothetical protein
MYVSMNFFHSFFFVTEVQLTLELETNSSSYFVFTDIIVFVCIVKVFLKDFFANVNNMIISIE